MDSLSNGGHCDVSFLWAAALLCLVLLAPFRLCLLMTVRRVKDHKAKNRIASAVISMSLAGPYSASLNDAIDQASNAGITVVTAAGSTILIAPSCRLLQGPKYWEGVNCSKAPAVGVMLIPVLSHGGQLPLPAVCGASVKGKLCCCADCHAGNNKGGDSCTMSPCSAKTAITVGATTDSDALASFSNIGRCLSVFAPGNDATLEPCTLHACYGHDASASGPQRGMNSPPVPCMPHNCGP